MYRTKPRLYAVLDRIAFVTGLVGLYGGILLISMQPTLIKMMQDSEMEGQTLWWKGFIDSLMADEFPLLTLTGIFMSSFTVIASYGIMHPRKIDWHWIMLIMLAQLQLIWSFSYRYIGTAFNIASIGIYVLTFLYLCRPKVKAYFEYVRSEKSAH